MCKFHYSLRTSLIAAVLIMGVLGMMLAMFTGEIYRHLAFDNQREHFVNLVRLKVHDLLDEAINNTSALGLSVQTNKRFRQALASDDKQALQNTLNEQFHRFFVTLEILKLEKLYAFDTNFNLLGYSSEGSPAVDATVLPCPGIIAQAKNRTGAARLKSISKLCLTNKRPYISVIVPIGGIRLQGYLLVAINPTLNLVGIEKALGTPLTLSVANGDVVYTSKSWPASESKNILESHYIQKNQHGQPIYNFNFATDVESLFNQLAKTRLIILVSASIITIIAVLLSLALLKKTAITPLATLTRQLKRVRKDNTHLGESVLVTGNAEVSELAQDFNAMSSELHVLYKTLENMAYTDSLTGLPNRAYFYDRLDQLASNTGKTHCGFLLLVFDLDRFKYVNDTLGHNMGDILLQKIADRLQNAVRATDLIARLGGDEFAAIMIIDDDHPGAAEAIAKKFLAITSQPLKIKDHQLTIGASIGIANCPLDGKDSHQLMQRADLAMYHAKKNRQGYTFYESHLDKHTLIQLNLELELKDAIDNNQLELYYQPKINLHNHCTTGVEALARWFHPERGFISPDEFIPLAEQTGLIHSLTRWVINTALQQCARWHKTGNMISVAVNISALSLENSDLLDVVNNALQRSGVAAHWLSLELTETAVMTNPDRAMEMLTRLQYAGVHISVDDFGTGYSSLAYLKKLPVGDIKIDKSFVMEMDQDGSDAVIVRSTIDLAHNMGLSVIAEGVENKAVWDLLAELGCDNAQGFYMCRPCNADDLVQWLETSEWGYKKLVKVI